MIVNFFSEIIITRLKCMFCIHQSKKKVKGLLCVVLCVFSFLMLVACEEDSDSPRGKPGESSAEHIFRGTVREIQGDALIRTRDGELGRLSVGQKIFEKNKLGTESKSSVVISVSDGSTLKMDGKSDVELDAKIVESLRRKVSVLLRHGRLMFDVQKQAVKDEFEIRADKLFAVASSTAGFVESVDGLDVFSLKDGRLEVGFENNPSSVISSGLTLLVNSRGVKVFPLSSSGTLFLARALDSIVTEAAAELGIRASRLSLEMVKAKLLAYDKVYKQKTEEFLMQTQPEFKSKTLNEYIGQPKVLLEAMFVPGAYITVQGIRDTIPESGLYRRTFEWDDSTAFGAKRFIVNCANDEVEYICYTWNTNFVSAKMAEVLTKADERKAVALNDSALQPQKRELAVVIEGSGRERIHVLPEERDIPATLRFSVTGLMGADLKQIKRLVIMRKGAVIKTYRGEDLTTNSFRFPIRLKQNRIAHFEVSVTLADGKTISAKKVYETYCFFDNYEGGKKSNRIYDMTAEEEYKNVVSKGLLVNE